MKQGHNARGRFGSVWQTPTRLEEATPTDALPGTQAKQDVMRARVERGEAVHADDVLSDPERHVAWVAAGNNAQVVGGEGQGRAEPGERKRRKKRRASDSSTRRVLMVELGIRPREPFGPRLRRLRLGRGISLRDLEAHTGISRSTLSRLEAGDRRHPSLALLWGLADALGMSIDHLVGR